MNIKKDRLYVIGRLIGIYREQRRGKSQNSFTQKSFAKDICSVNTLKRIESGETARDEYVYQSLLAKFNLKLGYYEDVDNYIESLMDSLYDAIEYYRLEDILTICGKALRVLNEVKEYIYYNELYALFKSTYQYYKEDIEVDVETMEHFYKIYSFMNKVYELLYKRLIFFRLQMVSIEEDRRLEIIFRKLDIENSTQSFMRILIAHYYLINKNYIKLKSLLDELENDFIEDNNYIRLLEVYVYSIYMYADIDKAFIETIRDKANILMKNHEIPDLKKSEIYAAYAYVYYNDKDYNLAYKYLNELTKMNIDAFLPYLVYIADCQNRLGKKIEVPKIKEISLQKYPRNLQIIYNYYLYYNDTPSLVKQNFIIKEIAPFLSDLDYIEVFRFELNKLVEETNSYKHLFLFDKITKSNILN